MYLSLCGITYIFEATMTKEAPQNRILDKFATVRYVIREVLFCFSISDKPLVFLHFARRKYTWPQQALPDVNGQWMLQAFFNCNPSKHTKPVSSNWNLGFSFPRNGPSHNHAFFDLLPSRS
jgi:hypothetical protein